MHKNTYRLWCCVYSLGRGNRRYAILSGGIRRRWLCVVFKLHCALHASRLGLRYLATVDGLGSVGHTSKRKGPVVARPRGGAIRIRRLLRSRRNTAGISCSWLNGFRKKGWDRFTICRSDDIR
jgi:hypothetical protein